MRTGRRGRRAPAASMRSEQIYNQVVAYAIDAPRNARVADAPVSYPFLWNAPQLDVVQWNGSAPNGLLGLGPLFRNVGEALGVFGEVKVEKTKFPEYFSSLNLAGLRTLEDMLKTLRPPAWPSRCAPINRESGSRRKASVPAVLRELPHAPGPHGYDHGCQGRNGPGDGGRNRPGDGAELRRPLRVHASRDRYPQRPAQDALPFVQSLASAQRA